MLCSKIQYSRNSPAGSQTQEKGDGRLKPPSTKEYRYRYSPLRCMSGSVRAAMRISRTSCSRPCGSSSEDTWKNRPNEREFMSFSHSDALVFFGATGDLAYKKIFPALQAMAKRGHLNEPVIGVAKAGWNLDQLKARARDSVKKHGGLDTAAFKKLCGLLRYVDGDYQSPATFQSIREQLGSSQRPAHYLAIPPTPHLGWWLNNWTS